MSPFSNFNATHKEKIQTQFNAPISKNRILVASGYSQLFHNCIEL